MTEYTVHINDFVTTIPDHLDYYDDYEEIIRLIKIQIKARDHGFKYENSEYSTQEIEVP